jgi:hypothetical protein
MQNVKHVQPSFSPPTAVKAEILVIVSIITSITAMKIFPTKDLMDGAMVDVK